MSFKAVVSSALGAWMLAAVASVGATGCAATVTAATPRAHLLFSFPVVHVDSPPARVYERPRVLYRGRHAYLVNGRWYYPSDGGWVYFQEEPAELRRYRERHADVRRAHPRRRDYEPPREQRRRRYYD